VHDIINQSAFEVIRCESATDKQPAPQLRDKMMESGRLILFEKKLEGSLENFRISLLKKSSYGRPNVFDRFNIQANVAYKEGSRRPWELEEIMRSIAGDHIKSGDSYAFINNKDFFRNEWCIRL
jgi:hypothetical protein